MTRQVTNLLLLYQSINFRTPPLLATRLLFLYFLFFSPLIHGIHLIKLALHCIHSPLYLPSKRYFSSLLSSTKFISPFLSLSFLGSQIYCLSLQYHHWFLSSSLKICRYHSKMLISTPSMNIQSFSLSQAQPILRKKTLLQKNVLTISRSKKKEDFYCKKSSIADLFQQYCKIGSTFLVFGSQVEPAGLHYLPVLKLFSIFYYNRTGLKAGSRLNRSDWPAWSGF